MKTKLFLIHNPYKRYERIFKRSINEKWVIFNKNKFLINYVVNKIDYIDKTSMDVDDLCKFLNIGKELKEIILEIYEICKIKPYDIHNHDPQISIVKNNSWLSSSLQTKLKKSC